MTVQEARARLTPAEFSDWLAFFKSHQRGGARTPEEENADVRAASLYALTVNANLGSRGFPVKAAQFMFYPPEPPKVEDRQAAAVAMMTAYAAAHNGNLGK